MHPCGHSSIKFSWSCDTKAQDSFSLFKLTQCFQNMLLYQFMHSFESLLGVWENFHSIHPSGVLHTFSFRNWLWSVNFFSKEKLEVISSQKHVGFSAERYILCSWEFVFVVFFFKLWAMSLISKIKMRLQRIYNLICILDGKEFRCCCV